MKYGVSVKPILKQEKKIHNFVYSGPQSEVKKKKVITFDNQKGPNQVEDLERMIEDDIATFKRKLRQKIDIDSSEPTNIKNFIGTSGSEVLTMGDQSL